MVLCAEGMAVEGDPAAALALFMRAWEARRDDLDASIAAHFVARHQVDDAGRLSWNQLALRHAEAVSYGRAEGMLASLELNLGYSLLAVGRVDEAGAAAERAMMALETMAADGYRDFVAVGVERLRARVAAELGR